MIAEPDAAILYATLAKGPVLGHDDRVNSTRHFMRELNRFGLTSVVDAGGGFQRYPEDYQIVEELHRAGQLSCASPITCSRKTRAKSWTTSASG